MIEQTIEKATVLKAISNITDTEIEGVFTVEGFPYNIVIDGVEYQYKEKTQSQYLAENMLKMAEKYGFGKKESERPNVNLLTEYIRVKRKQSKLSRSNRDWVEKQFKRQFIKVNP